MDKVKEIVDKVEPVVEKVDEVAKADLELLNFLLLTEVLKNLIFFSYQSKKKGLYNTKNEQISNSLFVFNL